MAAASAFGVSISSANCSINADARLKIDICSNAQRELRNRNRNPSNACFPPRTRGFLNNLRDKIGAAETPPFTLCPRSELASESEIPSKSSLSALELLKTSAADRKYPCSSSALF